MKCEATTHKKKKTKVKSKDVANDESMEDMVKRLVKKGMPEKFAASIAKKKFENKKVKINKKSKVKSKDVASDESMEDMVKRLVKKGMPEKFAASIAKKKFQKTKNESWMRGVFGADPSKKVFDGISEQNENEDPNAGHDEDEDGNLSYEGAKKQGFDGSYADWEQYENENENGLAAHNSRAMNKNMQVHSKEEPYDADQASERRAIGLDRHGERLDAPSYQNDDPYDQDEDDY